MLNFDDLKDQLTVKFNRLKDSIEESSFYNSIREKYETLPVTTQKGLLVGGILCLVVLLLSIPYSFISSSNNYITEYEETRHLIRALLKTRNLGGGPPLPKGLSTSQMGEGVKTNLSQSELIDDQLDRMITLPEGDKTSHLAPPNVTQQGVQVLLKKLNLQQVISIGLQLQNIDESIKMTGLEIKAATDDVHYFDVIYTLISYSLPETVEKEEKKDQNRRPPPDNKGK